LTRRVCLKFTKSTRHIGDKKRIMATRRPPTASKKPTAEPVRRRIGADARRAQILAVAEDLFLREGIGQTSMRGIASAAGVTATLLYKHFASKDDLLKAIAESFFRELGVALDEGVQGLTDPVARARAFMRAYVTFGIQNPRAYHLTFMTALPGLRRGEEMKRFRDKLRRGETIPPAELLQGMLCFARLEGAVADLVKAGLTRTRDIAALSEIVWSSGHGLVALVITHDDFGFTPAPKLIELSIDTMLNGLIRQD
jgi:AcrR family transcriptional regulator